MARHSHIGAVSLLVSLALLLVACKRDTSTTTDVGTGQFGQPGSGYVCQCSGWFPDWISPNPPPDAVESFQLAQGYPLGIPNIIQGINGPVIVGWNPYPPSTSVSEAPWLAFDFHVPAQRLNYINALKEHALEGMPEVDFVAQKNTKRAWFHAPMMTTSPTSRREPYHGVTKERDLDAGSGPGQHSWITSGTLDSFAIGYYDMRGGYTLGQIFRNPDPKLSDPSAARFIDGTVVFKLIFAEYDESKINMNLNPLEGSPEWQVQDVENPSAPLKKVRLLQVDVAVKDPRSTQTGWVFGTFVYNKSLPDPIPWRRLTPVGLQWGNDPDVTSMGVGTLDETWVNPAVPALFQNKLGRDGRLNGPVDNPRSSCISCHSTSQAVVGAANATLFRGVRLVPSPNCTNAQAMLWFRNILGDVPFGVMSGNNGCDGPANPAPAGLAPLDYSLQVADGLQSALAYQNPNPCQGVAIPDSAVGPSAREDATRKERARNVSVSRLAVAKEDVERPTPREDDALRR